MTGDPVLAHLAHLRLRGLSEVTIGTRANLLRRVAAHIAPVPLTDATAADLAAWRESLTQGAGTVAGYVSHAQGFYSWAAASGYMAADPSAGLPVPRLPRRLPRPISEEKLMYAVDAAARRIRPWLVLAAWAGLRAKEIALLRAENMHLHATPPSLLVASDATKGRRERVVALAPFAVAELTAVRLPARGLAFTKMDGGPMPPWLVSKLANQHLHDCGIPDTLHSLRHFFGTQIYHATLDLRLTQELMGHTTPAVTALYAAWDKPGAVAAVGALPVPAGHGGNLVPRREDHEATEPDPDGRPVLRLVAGGRGDAPVPHVPTRCFWYHGDGAP